MHLLIDYCVFISRMLCSVWLKDYKVKEGREEGEGEQREREGE